MENRFTHYSGPEYGWLKVPLKMIESVGLVDDISGHSRTDGANAYLEGDFDALMFMITFKEKYNKSPIVEYKASDYSFIYKLKRYGVHDER
jgi:hypothetical protein